MIQNKSPQLSQIITNVIQSQNQELLELTKASITHFNQITSLQGERAGLSLSILTAKKFSQSKCNPCCCGKPDYIHFHLGLGGYPAAAPHNNFSTVHSNESKTHRCF